MPPSAFHRFAILAPLLLALGGCSLFGVKRTPADQCADLMLDAFPDGDIDVTRKSAVNTTLAIVTATVEGTRNDVAPTVAVARDVAVECKFDHEVLVDFHWTKAPFR